MYKIFWEEMLAQIKKEISIEEFNMWFNPIKYVASEKEKLLLSVPSNFFKDQVKQRYLEKLENKLKEISGTQIEIVLTINKKEVPLSGSEEESAKKKVKKENKNHPTLRSDYTFYNFVIGSNNDFAANAAQAIAKNPGKAYNPFLIYGGVGLGKTHLLQAIGNEIYNSFDNKKIVFSTAEEFTNEFIESIKQKKPNTFKNKYRSVDVLLIDDIHFFQGKTETQEELFNTFNALHDSKKQMVFTCDRPPSELKNFTDRMRSRFNQGLIVDLRAPDFETRFAILKKKTESLKLDIDNKILELISKNITTNIRDLESALTKIIAYSELVKKKITIEIAQIQLSYLFADKSMGNLPVDTIIKTVAEYFNISSNDIKGKKRTKNIAFPRQIAMYIIRNLTELSTSEIGNEIGGRDHTTVIYAIQKVEDSIKFDPVIETVIQKIEANIREITGKS